MHIKRNIILAVLVATLILFVCIVFSFRDHVLASNQSYSGSQLSSSQPPILTASTQNKNLIEEQVKSFKKNNKNYQIFDNAISTYPSSENMVQAVVSYCDNEKKTKTNIAFITKNGISTTDLAGGSNDYEFADQGKVKIISKNTIEASLLNTKTKEILDFEVTYTYNSKQNESNYKIETKTRVSK